MRAALERLGPFDSVLDVGGNVGDFAELARTLWPQATVTSFEPLPALAEANRKRAAGRWYVEPYAISREHGAATLRACLNQPSASTLQEPGTVRAERFGIADRWQELEVPTRPLDHYRELVNGRTLIKVDVEGHEGRVLEGAVAVLELLVLRSAMIVECQQSRDVFEGAPEPFAVDSWLRSHGLHFAGVLGALTDPQGELVQFDGLWLR